jgi:hypothetical protein
VANPDRVDVLLTQWRRERPDVDVASLGVMARLFRAAHLADAALAESLAAHDLQPGWFDLLAALRRAGAPYELNPTTGPACSNVAPTRTTGEGRSSS